MMFRLDVLLIVASVVATVMVLVFVLRQKPKRSTDAVWYLQREAEEATYCAQVSSGNARAQSLLQLAKIRREQGLQSEALEAVRAAAVCASNTQLSVEASYWTGLILHELRQDVAAINCLDSAIAVPLHDLNPVARQAQLQACELQIRLLKKAGDDASTECVARRAYLLRNGF